MPGVIAVVCGPDESARVRRLAPAIDIELATACAGVIGERPVVVIGDPDHLPSDRRVVYIARPSLPDEQLAAVLRAVSAGRALDATPPRPALTVEDARLSQRAFTASRRLAAASDTLPAEAILVAAVSELVDADRVHCLFYDSADHSLWSEKLRRSVGDRRRAIAGITGWSAHTGASVRVDDASTDPRWSSAIDDPGTTGSVHLLAQPMVGEDGGTHVVLVAIRAARRSAFSDREAELLLRFSSFAGPLVDQLSTHIEHRSLVGSAEGVEAAAGATSFRREAVEAARAGRWGDVVRFSPSWVSWAYWMVVLVLIGAAVLLAVTSVSTYVSGPAVVRAIARHEVTAAASGRIGTVDVLPGDSVVAGAVIARFADEATGVIRAPATGAVSDLRVKAGEQLAAGDHVATLVDDRDGFEVVVVLAGEERSRLATGMSIHLDLAGSLPAPRELVVEHVSRIAVAPQDVRQLFGLDLGSSFGIVRPVVIVRARMRDQDGASRYHDREVGMARIRVGSERALFAILPVMRGI
jgi:hypothetical protein